ncbi:MAG: PPOX class F420-dependent oxidoreductase [Chloroflexi bacterium]|nr:MAG: PPOX class F420-dependent oxidoreductase [Chloroflexota bacterium]
MIVPESHKKLLRDDIRAFAFLATVMNDGSPQVTPVWFNWDGEYLLVNSAQGRVKDRNMRKNPNVSVAIIDPREMGCYLQIRGSVVDITTEGAWEHINQLSLKYTGHPWDGSSEQVRVIYRIKPENISVG